MALSQQDIALQMVAQLQALDPSVSAEVGTPERKIIDTVAQALAEAQIDLTIFQGAFDLNSKVGADLERFLGLFGFARQRASFATGVVQFSRTDPAAIDIRIPTGTQVAAGIDPTNFGDRIVFATTNEAVIPAGQTTVTTPVRAIIGGSRGNVAANTVTAFVGTPTLGVTAVTNPAQTTGGSDDESDDELKIRFTNTVFRNLAGTVDQYLALALATAFTSKANVVGPLSRYFEYIQVPAFDDATAYDINGDSVPESTLGNAGEYTTALSTIPYSKHIYETLPVFTSNSNTGPTQMFYTQDLDFTFNVEPVEKNRGDAYRLASISAGPDPLASPFQPNVTFLVVDSSPETDVPSPGQIILFEHSYMSDASRNDYERNILNCVDVFIDGGNSTPSSVVVPLPTTVLQFNSNPVHRYYYQNFRRIGEPEHRPVVGHVITPLMFQPVVDLPDSFTLSNNTYLKGEHYWAVEDITIGTRGTVRARNGIEWDNSLKGMLQGDPDGGPYTGINIIVLGGSVATMEINDYLYDRSVADLQIALEGARQTTTDVLAHKAHLRYFKFDLTVMYTPGATIADVNDEISDNINSAFTANYFGATIQLSDILQAVHDTAGVDNVRWSRDVSPDRDCVVEVDVNGDPRSGVIVDRVVAGVTGVTSEAWQFYLVGNPSGTYTLSHSAIDLTFNTTDSAATIQTALQASWNGSITCTGSGTAAAPFIITWPSAAGPQKLMTQTTNFTGGDFAFNTDFFLKDNELPALPTAALSTDTLPGFIIRARAQNTFRRG